MNRYSSGGSSTNYNPLWALFLLMLFIGCQKEQYDNVEDGILTQKNIPLDDSSYYDSVVHYPIETPVVHNYINNVTYDDNDYSYTLITDFSSIQTEYRKDIPQPVELIWSNNEYSEGIFDKRSIVVKHFNDIYFTDDLSYIDTSYTVYNLIPNDLYSYCVTDYYKGGDSCIVSNSTFIIDGQIRMINIDGVNTANFRDMGGWKVGVDSYVKYGCLIRGGEVKREDSYGICISDLGIKQLVYDVGVNVELDFGDISEESPLVNFGVDFYHSGDYQISSYVNGIKTIAERKKYANCISLIINQLSMGRTVYFHCNAGADRTGTLAFFLGGLLGLSESDLAKDYELTSFSFFGERTRKSDNYSQLVSYIKNKYEGRTISDKIYNMALTNLDSGGFGLSYEDIERYRKLMVISPSVMTGVNSIKY